MVKDLSQCMRMLGNVAIWTKSVEGTIKYQIMATQSCLAHQAYIKT